MPIKGRVALTGRPGVGKSTLIEKVAGHLRERGIEVGGMLTSEIRVCGHRVGFSITDIGTGRVGTLAHIHGKSGPTIGRYTVDLRGLEDVGVEAIRSAIRTADVVAIDEIAPMELLAPSFLPAVEEALASNRALLIATHAHVDHPMVHRIRQELELFRVRLGNRDSLVEEIASRFV